MGTVIAALGAVVKFSGCGPHHPCLCRVRVKGHLGAGWPDWFNGLALTHLDGGEARISGAIPGQAALHGVRFSA